VIQAGIKTKVPLWRLVIHDLSKFSLSEFVAYAKNFFGDYSQSPNDREKVSLEFTRAWLHHENCNPHHWGHWIPRSGKHANKPLQMPEIYVREMIADCMGASKAYTGSWNIAIWLNENGRNWILHPETVRLIAEVMYEMGYFITDNCDWSWMSPLDIE
jgi:hypothetical protein